MPAQLAATRALQDPSYYAARYRETHLLRDQLAAGLTALGWTLVPGCANFILGFLPQTAPAAAEFLERCKARGLFLRDASTMGRTLGDRAVRVAVKDAETTRRMLEIIAEASR